MRTPARSHRRLIARAGSTALWTMLCTVPREIGQSKRSRSNSTTARYGLWPDQHQGQDQLPQPGLGDGQVEEDVVGAGRGVEGVGQGVRGGVGLLIEELAADLMLPSQLGDRVSPSEDLDGEILPLGRQEPLGRPRTGSGRAAGVEVRLCERGKT